MDTEAVLQEFKAAEAILTGHFILSSGLHSSTYLQCARALMDAKRADRLCKALADQVRNWMKTTGQTIDVIVAPAMGGVVVGYEMGRQLGLLSMFCERVDGSFALRRGFTLEPGQKVLVVEDVVTTGKSSMEAVACIKQHGAEAVAVCSLIDRRSSNDVSLTLPLISLMSLDIPTYAADSLPESLKSMPAVKPGSRFLGQPKNIKAS
ncbi:MAG: orotate phosphoribosyltransferase [Rickettsiales bacterium]|nr:orotate phosphoribosyltransferase [Rickettsiales bacterium]